jgi:predicted small integral membrane protein
MMAVRIAKILLILSAGIFCLLVGYNNIVDYGSNFMFVQHVLTMDTTFPDNAVRASRALSNPQLHHLAYWLIIAAEIAIGLFCVAGALRLMPVLRAPADAFNNAKILAITGLAAGVGFWFMGFLVVGGEWFQMWQSQIWNGQESAFRFIGSIGLIMIFVAMDDRELPATQR